MFIIIGAQVHIVALQFFFSYSLCVINQKIIDYDCKVQSQIGHFRNGVINIRVHGIGLRISRKF